ncbi:hypothetical protein ACQUYL_28000, partial [Pseudomonas paraeruginosa]
MKRWLGVALGCSGLAMALACAGVLWMPSAETAASSSAPPTAGTAMAAAAVEDPPPVERARTPAAVSYTH